MNMNTTTAKQMKTGPGKVMNAAMCACRYSDGCCIDKFHLILDHLKHSNAPHKMAMIDVSSQQMVFRVLSVLSVVACPLS